MWLVFIGTCVVVVLVGAVVAYICNLLYISAQKHYRKFQKELEKEKKDE